jgi:hypothetical protein
MNLDGHSAKLRSKRYYGHVRASCWLGLEQRCLKIQGVEKTLNGWDTLAGLL